MRILIGVKKKGTHKNTIRIQFQILYMIELFFQRGDFPILSSMIDIPTNMEIM
jgi:hypothetical protein